jgi:deoxyribodipyrimidine photolyase-related protein
MALRNLVLVLGDQLDPDSAALDGYERSRDLIWMAELPEEATHVWSHKARIALFLSAMRHFADGLDKRRYRLQYLRLGSHGHTGFADALSAAIEQHRPERIVVVHPGDHRVLGALREVAREHDVELELREDRHFMLGLEEFGTWAADRKTLRLEHFYQHMRQRTGVLMEGREPAGGEWNYDKSNREAFGRGGPGMLPAPSVFRPDTITREVLEDVEDAYPEHPGSLEHFDWPVTPAEAEQALENFVRDRLRDFGPLQDAMWTDQPFLYHSRLSAALNLKLIGPRRVIDAAVHAFEQGEAPLASVEGFVRQILGWREFVRGLYWTYMPEYLEANALGADAPLPDFYWTGETDMHCLAQTIDQTLAHGYAHHIQRLMVTGLFALLLGVEPRRVHEWYLAVYVDAVEWVELPNTLGMSQFADGGVMGSKPYVASGKYIQRMSNYCEHCRYDPAQATGDSACPFTTLYWDFLIRHRDRFENHPRAAMQWRNLNRLNTGKRAAIARRANTLRAELTSLKT